MGINLGDTEYMYEDHDYLEQVTKSNEKAQKFSLEQSSDEIEEPMVQDHDYLMQRTESKEQLKEIYLEQLPSETGEPMVEDHDYLRQITEQREGLHAFYQEQQSDGMLEQMFQDGLCQASTSMDQPKEIDGEWQDVEHHMKKLCAAVSDDTTALYKERPCKDMSTLLKYDVKTWLKEGPTILKEHLMALCNLDNSDRSSFLLAKMIEQIYACGNQKLVLPLAFRENIITYKMSNSPKLSALNGASKPSGSHTHLNQWLKQAGSRPLEIPPGLVWLVFDNEQVIGKRYRIKANKTNVPASIVTSHACITIDKENLIQYNEDVKPSKWLFELDDEKKNR